MMGDMADRADATYRARVARVDAMLYPERCKLAYLSVLALMDGGR
jgi:hypothetical protein